MISDARLCNLTDWLKRIQTNVNNQPGLAGNLGEVIDCMYELMGDRAALAYMREFEIKHKLRGDA